MTLDFTKPETLQTRDGREVRIYATDCGGLYPNHGAVLCDNAWLIQSWSIHGKCTTLPNSDSDLIPKPPRVTGWVNWYKVGRFPVPLYIYKDKESAKAGSVDGCLGQVYIDSEIQP